MNSWFRIDSYLIFAIQVKEDKDHEILDTLDTEAVD